MSRSSAPISACKRVLGGIKMAGITMRILGIGALVAVASQAAAQNARPVSVSDDAVKIGVVTDLSGVNLDYGGPSAVIAAQMAADDLGGRVLGKPIQILALDHQNKPDLASQKVREWFDQQGVDMVTELLNSSVALAVTKIANEKKRVAMVVGAVTTRLTNEDCNPYTIHYAFDTYALGKVTGEAVLKLGGKSWFFLTADNAFGHSLEEDTISALKAAGGVIKGTVRHPAFQGIDFSSYMLQAQASQADVVGLANSSNDTVNAVKMANEFGVNTKQKLAALLMQISDVHALTLPVAKKLLFAEGWYWDLNEETRTFANRFFERAKRMPGTVQAGTYSATLQYLKAIEATGTDNPDAVMKWLKSTKINDMFAKGGYVREDGRMVHDMYLVQVKTPEESKRAWDYYDVRAVVPGEQAALPLERSKCSLVKQ
jgi:branched-chain amino acid transport system substrate-binding protein